MSRLIRKRKHDDDDEFEGGVEGQDILKLLNIEASTPLPDDILLPAQIRDVQFRVSTPEGYLFGDVEEFHAEVQRTINFLINALEDRDRDVVRLAQENDRMMVDIQNRRYENEFLTTQTSAATMDGAVEESLRIKIRDLETEKMDLAQQITDLQSQLVAARSNAVAAVGIADGAALSDEDREAYLALQDWAEQAEASFADLTARYDALEAEVTDLRTENERLTGALRASEEYAQSLDDYIDAYLPREGDEEGDGYGYADQSVVESVPAVSPSDAEAEYAEGSYYGGEEEYAEPSLSAPEASEASEVSEAPVAPPEGYETPSEEPTAPQEAEERTFPDGSTEREVRAFRPRKDETAEERRDRLARELAESMQSAAPELGTGIKRTFSGYESQELKPGAPLKSLPPGADASDYL